MNVPATKGKGNSSAKSNCFPFSFQRLHLKQFTMINCTRSMTPKNEKKTKAP